MTGGTNYLTKSFSYNPNGTIHIATDVNNAQTSYTYGDCNGTLPTAIGEPLSLQRSMIWDCNGGVVTSATDENSQITTYAYAVSGVGDPFYRVLSVTDPLQNKTSYTYTATTLDSRMLFNNNASVAETLQTTDGLGKAHVSQRRQTPSGNNYDSVEADYDLNGRPDRVTVTYTGTAGQTSSTAYATTTTYDGLNRPLSVMDGGGGTATFTYPANDILQVLGPAPSGENTKQRQFEYDGLGRLTSVCEVTAGTTSWPGTACAQNSSQTGYRTSYAYNALGQLTGVTQNAQGSSTQTRSYNYDALGRLLSETNPETGQTSPGTVSYTYDSDSSGACSGTYNGDLVKRVDNAVNVTCYAYDALHRVTSITYPSGPQSGVTKKKTFLYDTTTFNCPNGANVAGRLAEAYTGSSTSKVVDTAGCYDADGNITDEYQSSPNSGGSYHEQFAWWANGTLESVSGLPSMPSITYGLEGEGRIKTVSASSGQNPVTGTTYNVAADGVSTMTLGSGDEDTFSYDGKTARTIGYTTKVNGQSVSGALTWNPNGTLKKLIITDPVNSANAQTCTYLYDDLVRIGAPPGSTGHGVNCGASVWQQDFSYDPFGNITKSVPTGGTGISWQPGYSTTTNHYTLSGTSYDKNGDLTNDSFNTYTWDVDGNQVTVNGTSNTFDAFGRIVETAGATQFIYLPGETRVFAKLAGQTLTNAYVPLPFDNQAVYNASGLAYYRNADWEGSSRIATTPSRTVYSDQAYAPFGESYATSGTSDLMFADMTQDVPAGGVYDTPNRKYHATQGRWIIPDPAGRNAVALANPKSWNRYAYALNNPLANTDPLGLYCAYLNDAGDGVESIDNYSGVGECGGNGGYWIEGNNNNNNASWVMVDSNSGLVGGYGVTSDGFIEWSVAGAEGSNPSGAWTQTWGGNGPDTTVWLTYDQQAIQTIGNVLNTTFPTACTYSISGRLSVGGLGASVNSTESGTSASVGPSAALSNFLRITVGLNTNGPGVADPSSTINIGPAGGGLAVNPLNGQVGAYVGKSFNLFGFETGATLKATVGKIGTNASCAAAKHN